MSSTTRLGRWIPLLLFLLPLPAGLAPAARAGDPTWREAVDASDRGLLDRLLSADDATRKAAADEWDVARPPRDGRRRPRRPVDALSDQVDPLDPWAVRKKRMLTALATALQQGEVPQRVAAARSIRDLAPAYTTVIDALAVACSDDAAVVRRAVLETLGGIAHLAGGRYVDTKLSALVSRIEDEDASVRAAALELAGLRLRHGHADDGLRWRALGLALDAADDESAAVRAAALAAADAMAAPREAALLAALRRGLDDASPRVRRAAAGGWSGRPEDAESVLGRLRALLKDGDFDVRYAAARAVWSSCRDATGLMPVLVEALDRFEGADLAATARLLTEIGPPAQAATPGLVHALGRVEPMPRLARGREVHEALVSIGPFPSIALPAIEEELHRRAPAERPAVLEAVVTVFAEPDRLAGFVGEMLALYPCPDPAAVEATVLQGLGIETPHLLEMAKQRFDAEDARVRHNACYHLGRMRSPAAVQLLVDKMQEPGTHVPAIIALRDVGEHAQAAIPALVRALPGQPRLAARALVRIAGPQDPDVVKALLATLEQTPADDHGTVVALCDAICLYGGELEPCLDRLIAAFGDRNPMMHRDAAEALGRWGPRAEKALPVLRKTMEEGEIQYEGMTSAGAVWQVSGEPGPTLELAVRSLKSPAPTSWLAVHVLHLLGPEAAPAVPVLIDTALSWRRAPNIRGDVLKEAIAALGAIGPAAAEALPVLRELEHNHLVRAEARQAILKIGND